VTTVRDIDVLGAAREAERVQLTDLLVSIAVLGLVLAGTLTLLEEGQRSYAIGAARVEAQQNARIAVERIGHDIRNAGFGLPNAEFAAISIAEPQRIVMHYDLNQDGIIAGPRETVTWLLRGNVLRRNAGGGAQPIIQGVRSFALAYLDASGNTTVVPADVRTVIVTLTTGPDHSTSIFASGLATTVTTQVRVRNRW